MDPDSVRARSEEALRELERSTVPLFLQERRRTLRLRLVIDVVGVASFLCGVAVVAAAAALLAPTSQLASSDRLAPALRLHLLLGTVSVATQDRWSGNTALHYACEAGALEAVSVLLASNASVRAFFSSLAACKVQLSSHGLPTHAM